VNIQRITAGIDTDALRYNFRALQQLAADASVMAVVKANAYGHGLAQCVPCLFDEGCRNFAVTDATEGSTLRQLLPPTAAVDIHLLAGIANADDAALCQRHHLSPVIIDATQVALLQQVGFDGVVWLKVDTGMNRTGASNAQALYRLCQQRGISVRGILSHLACADTPSHPLNIEQCQRFQHIKQQIPELDGSLLNSAGLCSLAQHRYHMVRPGIALYGVEPCEDRTLGLKPVMQLTASVVQTRQLVAGDGVGYGSSFIAPQAMRIAVIAAGYGDGIPRALSQCGTVYIHGTACPIIGRVCMDYCMVDIGALQVRRGDRAIFWGTDHAVTTVAHTVNTIAYELLTRIANRVPRYEL
jgi:alanine racemase